MITVDGLYQENNSRTFDLPDDDAEALAGMLRYFYGLKPHLAAKDPGIYFELKLFAVAGKYDVQGLLEECVAKVKAFLEVGWHTSSFSQVVFDIYERIPAHGSELRNVARDICREHLTVLMLKKDFKQIMLGSPELQFNILKKLADEERARR